MPPAGHPERCTYTCMSPADKYYVGQVALPIQVHICGTVYGKHSDGTSTSYQINEPLQLTLPVSHISFAVLASWSHGNPNNVAPSAVNSRSETAVKMPVSSPAM